MKSQADNKKTVLDSAVRKAGIRLIPALVLMYMISYLDRANIGFAKQSFQYATGVSEAAFAFGASIFFIGYAVFEFPSNLALHKFGARKWMARIMVSWGMVATLMIYVSGDLSFYLFRFLLGAMEAGFFPGAILFMTYWFPSQYRGKMLGLFYFGSPMAMMFGGPLSGGLLSLHGFMGLDGWQWLFLIEGIGTVLIGILIFFYLTDKPQDAKWLTLEEKNVLLEVISAENAHKQTMGRSHLKQGLGDIKLYQFCAIYLLIAISGYGFAFYMPSQISAVMNMDINLTVGFVAAIPWLCAIIAAIFYPSLAVRLGKTVPMGIIALLAIGLGLIISVNVSPVWAIVSLCFVAMGIICAQPIFWTFPSNYFGGVAAAGCIAIINAIGNLGGFVAPNVKVFAESLFGAQAGIYALACAPLLAAILFLFIRSRPERVSSATVEHS